jgi:PBSX family phage terminase large subunit
VSGETVLGAFEPTERQLDAARAWVDPASRVVVLDGAIRSGKTQCAARLLLESAVEQPATYLVARSTYRSLKDSTEKALLHGDGGLPPLIPPELVKEFRVSDEIVRLHSGAEILFRSLEEGNLGKILNLSLAGVLVDQIEELDPGDAGERVFDTLLGRLSDPRGPRKLLCVANPAGLASWQYRRLIDEQTRDPGVRRVHFTLLDNEANLPADYLASMQATRETRPHWYASFIEGRWGAFEGQAFPEFSEQIHVVERFEVPAHWGRFESMDHGAASPTAWYAWAADEDGNLVVIGEHYAANMLVSQHAAEVLRLRQQWHPPQERYPCVYADPSTGAKYGLGKLGEPATVMTEYVEHGIALTGANNDRAAGYTRLLELLHVEPGRLSPPWAGVPEAVGGSPRLFVFRTCRNLIAQLQSAPVAVEGVGAGQMVDPKWESASGHAIASARYGALSWQLPAEKPPLPQGPVDERAEALRQSYEAERERWEAEAFDRWEAGLPW